MLDVSKWLLAVMSDCTAWQNSSQPQQPGLCTSTSPAAISQAGFSSSYSEGLHPGLSGNIYSSVSNEVFCTHCPLCRLAVAESITVGH